MYLTWCSTHGCINFKNSILNMYIHTCSCFFNGWTCVFTFLIYLHVYVQQRYHFLCFTYKLFYIIHIIWNAFFLDTNDKISKWICFQIWWSKSTRFWVRFIFIKNSCLHTTYDTHKHFLYWNPNVRKKMAFKTTNENLILCIISDTISLLNKYDYYASLREIVQVFFLPKLLACCFFSR